MYTSEFPVETPPLEFMVSRQTSFFVRCIFGQHKSARLFDMVMLNSFEQTEQFFDMVAG